jgi:hypothetical protein
MCGIAPLRASDRGREETGYRLRHHCPCPELFPCFHRDLFTGDSGNWRTPCISWKGKRETEYNPNWHETGQDEEEVLMEVRSAYNGLCGGGPQPLSCRIGSVDSVQAAAQSYLHNDCCSVNRLVK